MSKSVFLHGRRWPLRKPRWMRLRERLAKSAKESLKASFSPTDAEGASADFKRILEQGELPPAVLAT